MLVRAARTAILVYCYSLRQHFSSDNERLLRTSENGQGAHDWIGASTNEWMFMILRPECAGVRARAKNALAQLRATPVAVEEVRAAGVKADLASIKADAEKQHCSLDADIIDAGAMHH
jgi:hypothetical protein